MDASIESIVESYRDQAPEVTVEDEIRVLDKMAKGSATKPALVLGIAGLVLLGIGMSLTMEAAGFFALGIVIGVVGLGLCASAYPVYSRKLASERELIRDEVLALASRIAE